MRIPGFGPKRPLVVDGPSGRVVLERRPGESVEAFELRRAAYEREMHTRDHAAAAAPRDTFGRADALDRNRDGVVDRDEVRHDRGRAYADGRRDQHKVEKRRKRGGFGWATAFVVLVAALGVVWLALSAREGSFAAGGAVVDQKVAAVTAPARVAVNNAADRTGAAVQNAGQALENQGERIRDTAR